MSSHHPGGPLDPVTPAKIARSSATHAMSNWMAAVVSLIALVFSAWSLWETTLKRAEIAAFVPAVIHFSAPFQNTNFEVVQVPVTISNDGAQTATVVALELAVVDPAGKARKRFYAADFGRWTMQASRDGKFHPFAPISVPGQNSRTETILFYTRGDDEKPNEIFRPAGDYKFELSLTLAEASTDGFLDSLLKPGAPPTLNFTRTLNRYDARAFIEGTLPLFAPDWSAARSGAGQE